MTYLVNFCIFFTINQKAKTNDQITAAELLIIDDKGKNLGVMKQKEALELAQEKGLDLIEISPFAKPPVARILDYDKFRYQQEKKLKKQKTGRKEQETKQIQISIRSAKNDLLVKAKRANNFLEKGHIVRVVMVLRGREKANKEFAKERLNQFLEEMVDPHKVMMAAKSGGRGIIVHIQSK